MEQFTVSYPSAAAAASGAPVICGVVASGNLEVLVEPLARQDQCEISVSTSAGGFRPIWEAVLQDFSLRHAVGGMRLSINDAGATPAVVSLRLDQAFDEFRSKP